MNDDRIFGRIYFESLDVEMLTSRSLSIFKTLTMSIVFVAWVYGAGFLVSCISWFSEI